MDFTFTVQTRIAKPIADVFDAIVNPQRLCRYFTDRSSGPLTEGQDVTWTWTEYGDARVTVRQIIPNQSIVLGWKAADGDYDTAIEMTFESLDGDATLLKIKESGWRENQKALDDAFDHCGGWQDMANCLKAYLLFDVDLRRA